MERSLSLPQVWPRRRLAAAALAAVLVIASLVTSSFVYHLPGVAIGPNDYDIPAWELRNFPSRWLFAFGQLFRDKPSVEAQNADLLRFFQLTREINVLESEVSDASQRGQPADPAREESLKTKRTERDRLENGIEATIEGRVTAAIKESGVTRSLGPLGNVVWPPVDFELTRSPYTLVVSPRDHIELQSSDLLREDLDIEALQKIENDKAKRDNVSTLAVPTGGIGAYPTIVDYPTSYQEALEIVSHEWTHNYLFFRPLGFNYYRSNALRTMNETVADLVGHELAGIVTARWPIEAPAAPSTPPQRPARNPDAPRPDVGAALRQLRGEVDALLADHKIDEAEALMEQRRQELSAQGVYIRKINQAYFAFNNLYAGSAGAPGATNPIGPKIDQLRKQSGSLRAFVRVMGDVTSVSGLDRALAAN